MILGLFLSPAMASSLAAGDVPEAVKASFADRFPNAVVVEWDFDEDDNAYEVDAKIAQNEVEAIIAQDGKILRTKEDVSSADIPASVLKKVHEQWPRAEILGANKHTDVKKGVIWDVGLKLRNHYRNVEIQE